MSAEDRLAIIETIARYSHAWGEGDTDRWIDVFTDDAVFEVRARDAAAPHTRHAGRDALYAWAKERHASREGNENIRPMNTGTVFEELTGTTARTRTMLLQTQRAGEWRGPSLNVSGIYTDDWRKTADGWRLAYRRLQLDVER